MKSSSITIQDRNRVLRAKAAYTTRRIPREDIATLVTGDVTPKTGDVVLARIEKVGQHPRIELATGRRSRLFVGDEVLLCVGNRYAPDQFEAVIPRGLGQCAMVAAGGIAAEVLTRSDKVANATAIHLHGLVGDGQGNVLNLERYALPKINPSSPRQVVLAVAGTAMNAGKTETVTNLIKGLVHAGFRVGAAKVTGTGAGGDVWSALDAGANPVLDFTDAGLASTYQVPAERVERAALTLLAYLSESEADVIVLELADGLLQTETARLLESQRFASFLDGVIFAAGDALGAVAGIQWLNQKHLNVLGASGVLTRSPLAIRELETVIGMPVFGMDTLNNPLEAAALVNPFIRQSACVA